MTAIILSLIAIPYVLLKEYSITAMQLGFLCLITIVFDIANILLINRRNFKKIIYLLLNK
jgi:hypothetical protein